MTDHVPTKETCQKLKESGFPQSAEHYWHNVAGEPEVITKADFTSGKYTSMPPYPLAAPILTEMIDGLPMTYTRDGHTYNLIATINENYAFVGYEYEDDEYSVDYGPIARMVGEDARLIEAAALLYLELHA